MPGLTPLRLDLCKKGFPDTRRKLKLKNGTIADIKSFFDSSILASNTTDTDPAYEIICTIKKLWLSDEIYCTNGSPSTPGGQTIHVDIMSGVMLRMEFFALYNNECAPLYRYDTTIVGTETVFKNGGTLSLVRLIGKLKKALSIYVCQDHCCEKKLNYSEIEQYNAARFSIPILEQIPRKGIYMSFEEFKNNQPSITEYRVNADKMTDEIYAKDGSGKEMLLRNVYGFSDGTNVYIGGAGNFFQAAQNT